MSNTYVITHYEDELGFKYNGINRAGEEPADTFTDSYSLAQTVFKREHFTLHKEAVRSMLKHNKEYLLYNRTLDPDFLP